MWRKELSVAYNIEQKTLKSNHLLNADERLQRVVPELCRRELRFLVGLPKADWSVTQRY